MTRTMPHRTRRQARHHRVWRLARLLMPDRPAARDLVRRIASERPDLHRLDPARLDRLIVLRARELADRPPKRRPTAAGDPPDTADPLSVPLVAELLRTAHTLPRQVMEAWMLRHVDRLGDIDISRAMDCSRTALARHLDRADRAMRDQLGDQLDDAVQTLRDALEQLDPAPAVRIVRQRRRRRWVTRLILSGAAAAGLALLATSLWNSGWVQRGLDALLHWLNNTATGGGG